MTQKILISICMFLTAYLLPAQKLMVTNIEETRSMNGGWDVCMVEVKLIGDEARNFTHYRVNEITSATDNKGINLLKSDDRKTDYVSVNDNFRIELMKASRSATDISISGSLTMYKPTESNGGIVKINNFTAKPGTNIAPKGSLFSIYYYDNAFLEKRSKMDYEKRLAEIDKLSGREKEIAQELDFLVQSTSYYSPEEMDRSLFFLVEGDTKHLVGIEFENSKGKKVEPMSSSKSNMIYTYYFDSKPENNMKMVLNLETPKSTKLVPFTLKGVDLP